MKDDHVFLNVPFDKEFEPLYLAFIAGLVGLGLNPRTVLQVPTTNDRIRRIWSLMRECRYSIHDLSRVQLSRTGQQVPRFNMPFETGMAVALAQTSGHQWRVFEQRPYRLQQSLSDLNGFEPFIHGGTARGVIDRLLDAFRGKNFDRDEIRRLHRELLRFRSTLMGRDVFQPYPFDQLVRAAIAAREKLRGL